MVIVDSPSGRTCKTLVRLPAPETLRLSGHFPWLHGATASTLMADILAVVTVAIRRHYSADRDKSSLGLISHTRT